MGEADRGTIEDEMNKAWELHDSGVVDEDTGFIEEVETDGVQDVETGPEDHTEGVREAVEKAHTEDVDQEPEKQGQDPGGPGQPEAIEVPRSWPQADGEVFKSLPPEVQRNIFEKEQKRDHVFAQKIQEANEAVLKQDLEKAEWYLKRAIGTF